MYTFRRKPSELQQLMRDIAAVARDHVIYDGRVLRRLAARQDVRPQMMGHGTDEAYEVAEFSERELSPAE